MRCAVIGDQHTSVTQIEAQLKKARYDLDQTTVRAPADGTVNAATPTPTGEPFGVNLNLDDAIVMNDLPGDAIGTTAIYTDRVKGTHVIRKVMLRMKTYTNYVLP